MDISSYIDDLAANGRYHFTTNVTDHPTSAWVVQQIREAFPLAERDS